MRRPAFVTLLAVCALKLLLFGLGPTSPEPVSSSERAPTLAELQQLQQRVSDLEADVAALADRVTALESPGTETSPDPSPAPSPEPTRDPTPDPTQDPTPDPAPGSTTDSEGTPTPAGFPTPDSVGPDATPTEPYAGRCRVTTDDLVIEDMVVDCPDRGLVIARGTTGVVIRNAVVNGGVFTEFTPESVPSEDDDHPLVFTVESSRILSGTNSVNNRAFGYAHFEIRDSYLRGVHSGGWAHNGVVIEDSYITTTGESTHQSALRMLKNSTLRGNTIFCTPAGSGVDGGCSADGVFYREFGVPVNLTIEGNYFRREPGQGQWYATRFINCHQTDDCVDLRVVGNLFDLGQGTDAGEFPDDAGDVWQDNWWVDGEPALPDQSR